MARKYAYVLIREEIEESANQDVKDWGTVYSKDKGKAPIPSFHADSIRGLTINGQEVEQTLTLEEFERKINGDFKPEDVVRLGKHYSQAPMMFVSKTLIASGSYPLDTSASDSVIMKQPESYKSNLYESKGEVYVKITANKYPIHFLGDGNNPIGFITGPVEALFKLTDKGFELQHVSTDSPLLRDMYLGKLVSKDRILRNIIDENKQIECKIDEIEIILKKEKQMLDQFPSAKQNTLIAALEMIRQCKEEKISIEDFQASLSFFLGAVSEFEKQPSQPIQKAVQALNEINNLAKKAKPPLMSVQEFQKLTSIPHAIRPGIVKKIDATLRLLQDPIPKRGLFGKNHPALSEEQREKTLKALKSLLEDAEFDPKVKEKRKSGLKKLSVQVDYQLKLIESKAKLAAAPRPSLQDQQQPRRMVL